MARNGVGKVERGQLTKGPLHEAYDWVVSAVMRRVIDDVDSLHHVSGASLSIQMTAVGAPSQCLSALGRPTGSPERSRIEIQCPL